MITRSFLCILLFVLLVGTVSADTLIINPTQDGFLKREPYGTWVNARNGAGSDSGFTNSYNLAAGLRSDTTENLWQVMSRGAYVFNTTLIPDDATITSAKIGVTGYRQWSQIGYYNLVFTGFNPSNPSSLATSDYNKFTDTEYSDRVNISVFSSMDTHYNFTLNSGALSYINKTGNSPFLLRQSWDVDNSSPVWVSGKLEYFYTNYNENVDSTLRPFLEITYTEPPPPDTTPPASITNLSNSTATCQEINWSWTNPVDADFNHTYVLKDNVFYNNLSNTTTFSLWQNLTGGQNYTFSSKTVDTTGNMNETWVNMTATPTACGFTPVANFIANATSICINETVFFNDTSTNIPTSWYWMFGDNTTSTDQNLTHLFNTTGFFNISLKATNAFGNDWENKTNYIYVDACTPPPSGCFFVNLTNITVDVSSVDWEITQDLATWGVRYNISENWSSYYYCILTPTPTPIPTWGPVINPSTESDIRPDNLIGYWWVGALIVGIIVVFRKW